MLLTINTDDPRPIYQQVADGIKELIAGGKLEEGAALPPVRQLAADLGVNLNTIATAYRELQKEGLITVLTQMVLAGLPESKILRLVISELHLVGKGNK